MTDAIALVMALAFVIPWGLALFFKIRTERILDQMHKRELEEAYRRIDKLAGNDP